MDEQPDVTLSDILQSVNYVSGQIGSVQDNGVQLHQDLQHVSGQMDILNHQLYVLSTYQQWTTISLMVIAAVLMFLLGYLLTRR